MKFNKVYKREKFLKNIRPFFYSDIIKVITGIRRCGKSYILKAIYNELIDNGVKENEIVFIPLDQRGFKDIKTPTALEKKIELLRSRRKIKYLFIDEVQNVKGFESVVQAYCEEGASIFLTGSNSYLLSDEITTKLTGRYLSFEIYTLDFMEYLEMKKFHKLQINDLENEFNEFILNGGFPKSLEYKDASAKQYYSKGIIDEIFKKDVKTRHKITNVALFERVQSYMVNNYSASFSLKNLLNNLSNNSISTKSKTIRNYIEDLEKAKILYECNSFDLKSLKSIKRDQKYYLADLSIYFAMNTDNRLNYGSSLENLVYLYLVSNGYQVSYGKIGSFECDFIVRDKNQDYAYIQVVYSLQGVDAEDTLRIKEREYRPFRYIKDGYPRYIITLDKFKDRQEGVHHINAIDLFMGKEKIGNY